MRTASNILIALLILATASFAAEMKYGSLNVFSKTAGTKIYVDGEAKGNDSVQIKEIQAGTHFVKVTSILATPESTIYAEIIEVEAGELTTIFIDEKGQEVTKKVPQKEEVDVFKTKKVLDYSKEMHTGWYVKAGYLTNFYYSTENFNLDNYASAISFGLGFKIPIAPSIDFSLEMERAEFSTAHDQWYFMPVTANIQISFLPSQYFRGKQYYGLGLGYFMTNLEDSLQHNLTTMGYHLFYGLEMPASDKSAYFIEFGYHSADISRYSYIFNASTVTLGYRWDVAE